MSDPATTTDATATLNEATPCHWRRNLRLIGGGALLLCGMAALSGVSIDNPNASIDSKSPRSARLGRSLLYADHACNPNPILSLLLPSSRCVCSEQGLRRRISRRKLWKRLGGVSTIALCTGATIVLQQEIDLTSQRIEFVCGTTPVTTTPLAVKDRCRIATAGTSRMFVSIGGADATVSFTNIDFVGGYAFPGHGGALSFDQTGGDVTIANCTFANNTGQFGGAILVTGASSTLTIRHSSFRGNFAEAGGAIFVEQGVTINITNSIVATNQAVSIGGGMVMGEGTVAYVAASRILDNLSGVGGGLLAFRSKVNLVNTLFTNNKNLQQSNDISILDDVNPAQNGTFVRCDAKSTVKFCDGLFGILELSGKAFLNTNCNQVGVEVATTCPKK